MVIGLSWLLSLVVVHKLNIVYFPGIPYEAESPVPADPQAVFALSAPLQGFKASPRYAGQVLKYRRSIHQLQEMSCPLLEVLRGLQVLTIEELFQFLLFECPYHRYSVLRSTL